jgi:DNA-binding transcriptional MerR regulator
LNDQSSLAVLNAFKLVLNRREPRMEKSADAFRTISEAAGELELPQHVLRFWETRFPQIKPLKRAGGRRYYRPRDIEVLRLIKRLLYGEGYTIKGVQRVLKEQDGGVLATAGNAPASRNFDLPPPAQPISNEPEPAPPSQRASVDYPAETKRAGNGRTSTGSPAALDSCGFTAKEAGQHQQMLSILADDIGRLRAALSELAECDAILGAARRA